MKNIIILTSLLFVSHMQQCKAQTYEVEWIFLSGDTLTIAKMGANIVGTDTLSIYHVFQGATITDSLFLKEGGDTTFLYFDSAFYFLYANNAEIGDVWHPLKFINHSFKDTCGFLNLKVINLDSVFINGEWLNEIELQDMEGWGNYLTVIEKIGSLTIGVNQWNNFGMLYNYLYSQCSAGADYPPPCLISYHSQSLNYDYVPGYNCYADIDANFLTKEEPLIKRTDNRIEVTWNDNDVELELYNISGQKVKSAQKNNLSLPQEQGIYFLHIQQNTDSRVVKLAN
jgi:hypothetical protein